MASDGWEDVTDPHEVQRAQIRTLPKAPPKSARSVSKDDEKALNNYRDAAERAARLEKSGANFMSRANRFHTGAGKAMVFDAMYPDGSGIIGPLKRLGGAALRGTVGALYSNQDHKDYQYLTANAEAINNDALRQNKGTQTEGDAARIAKENMSVGRSPQVNSDIYKGQREAALIAKAQQQGASNWLAQNGSLAGSRNAEGQTFDEWFARVGRPRALNASKAPKTASKGGWSISRD